MSTSTFFLLFLLQFLNVNSLRSSPVFRLSALGTYVTQMFVIIQYPQVMCLILMNSALSCAMQLDDLMRGLGFTQRKADGQVRWAVLNTVTLLRRHKAVHSKLAAAMSFGKTVAECIGVIETELASVAYI